MNLGDPGTERVEGHSIVPSKPPLRSMQPCSEGPCSCGHANLKVLAWPAPAGEGVLCRAVDGNLHVHCRAYHERPDLSEAPYWRDGPGHSWFIPVTHRPEDAPIREAWERLCDDYHDQAEAVYDHGHNPPSRTPPDALYLFVEHDVSEDEGALDAMSSFDRGLAEMGGELDSDGVVRRAPALGKLLPVQDVTEAWGHSGELLRLVEGFKSLCFTAPGKEPVWYTGEGS